jgi:AcrR family transcriptional regulator
MSYEEARVTRKQTVNAEARRTSVLETSTEIFSRRGYRGTSMNDIAAAVGLGKPSLYHYFASKEEILTQLYENVLAESVAEAQIVVDETPDPLEALRKLLVARVVYTCEHSDLLKIFFEEEGELPEEMERSLLVRRGGFEQILKSLVKRHLAESGVTLPSSVSVYVNTCLGAVNWVYKWYDPAGSSKPQALGEEMAALLMEPLGVTRAATSAGRKTRRGKAAASH